MEINLLPQVCLYRNSMISTSSYALHLPSMSSPRFVVPNLTSFRSHLATATTGPYQQRHHLCPTTLLPNSTSTLAHANFQPLEVSFLFLPLGLLSAPTADPCVYVTCRRDKTLNNGGTPIGAGGKLHHRRWKKKIRRVGRQIW